jgi:outer membrane immunogenic protein
MRKLLLSGATFGVLGMPAMAADVAPAYKIPAPIPAFSWSGCYVGGDVGGAWGSQGVLNSSPLAVAFPPVVLHQAPANTTATGSSVIGGGHIGCNYQWTPFLVVGIEADYSGASLNATGNA